MTKVKLSAYSDKTYSSQLGEMEFQMNPSSLKLQKGIKYQDNKQLGDTSASGVFERYDGEKLSFEVLIDSTGVVAGTQESDTADSKVGQIEKLVYVYQGSAHRPSFVKIAWGTFLFKGQLCSLKTEYGLFNAKGSPLRAKVSLEFASFTDAKTAKKSADKQSPDVSHLVTVRAGETLPLLCQQIYGDSTLVNEVARVNGLNGFRRIAPGTTILFPQLQKG